MNNYNAEKMENAISAIEIQQTIATDPMVLSEIVVHKNVILDYMDARQICAAYFDRGIFLTFLIFF